MDGLENKTDFVTLKGGTGVRTQEIWKTKNAGDAISDHSGLAILPEFYLWYCLFCLLFYLMSKVEHLPSSHNG